MSQLWRRTTDDGRTTECEDRAILKQNSQKVYIHFLNRNLITISHNMYKIRKSGTFVYFCSKKVFKLNRSISEAIVVLDPLQFLPGTIWQRHDEQKHEMILQDLMKIFGLLLILRSFSTETTCSDLAGSALLPLWESPANQILWESPANQMGTKESLFFILSWVIFTILVWLTCLLVLPGPFWMVIFTSWCLLVFCLQLIDDTCLSIDLARTSVRQFFHS